MERETVKEQFKKELWNWAEKLPEYGQCKNMLYNKISYNPKHCCLGVLAELKDYKPNDSDDFRGLGFIGKDENTNSILIKIFGEINEIYDDLQRVFSQINDELNFMEFEDEFEVVLTIEDKKDRSFKTIGNLILKYKEQIAKKFLKFYYSTTSL